MRFLARRLSATLAVAALALSGVAATAPEGFELVPATDRLFVSAGCPQDTPGTCTSTRWLGRSPGDANSNFLTSTTPADEVLYQAEGEPNWRDYGYDGSGESSYMLRGGADIVLAVQVQTNVLAANMTFHGKLTATKPGSFIPEVLIDASETTTMLPSSNQTFTFTFTVPESMDGMVITSPLVEVALHGVNLQGGYINQSGGSTLTLPYYKLVPSQ